MKTVTRRTITILIVLVTCVALTSLIMPDVLYKLPHVKFTEENNNSAIIYVWGHLYFEDEDYFNKCGITEEEIVQMEYQCANSVFENIQELREKWNWDLYIFYGIQPKFERYQYENLLVFFSGHGKFKNNQNFMINRDQVILVKEIGRTIQCRNITVIVDSCYSINWQYDFKHDNLTSIYTSDLYNKTTPYRPYPDCTVNVEYLASFNYLFINNLLNGLNYADANRTTIETFFSMFPYVNSSSVK